MKGVKIIQAGLDLDNPREFQSYQQLSNLGIRYVRIQNDPYTEEPPLDKIYGGNKEWYVGKEKNPNTFGFTPRHYGAYLSHIQSIMLGFADKDHSLICEGDCRVLDTEVFKSRLEEAVDLLNTTNYPVVRFETPNHLIETTFHNQVSDNIHECDKVMLGHCYLVNNNSRDFWYKMIEEVGWHTPDWWLVYAFSHSDTKMLCFKDTLTHQFDGYSEIDKVFKTY